MHTIAIIIIRHIKFIASSRLWYFTVPPVYNLFLIYILWIGLIYVAYWNDVNSFFLFTANDALLKVFGKCKDGKTRVLKVSIVNGNIIRIVFFFIFYNKREFFLQRSWRFPAKLKWKKIGREITKKWLNRSLNPIRLVTFCSGIYAWTQNYYIFKVLINFYVYRDRLDEKMSLGYAWLLLSWTPDSATIRQKMLYASTKATLKNEFGSSHIKEEYNATVEVSARFVFI